ncbi:dTMP kinase [Henriciella litoralis]|uniref:dTMP kinase n=1 Tax=Henriciella litoralis TaxID=568102 RepID=UPI0009FE914B|nr:dTMP kinase [Henriciella litoralis]
MTARGRFITIEGGEGTGKSTLIEALAQHLRSQGLSVVVTREPGGTPLAEKARELVLSTSEDDSWSGLAQTLLVSAARADHIEKRIEPALSAGSWVLCDRFADSTRVYQRLSGASPADIETITALAVADTGPDLTLLLDGPVKDLLGRRESRGVSDTFESRPISFHEDVRKEFLALAAGEPDRFVILDAMKSPDEVLGDAIAALASRLSLS